MSKQGLSNNTKSYKPMIKNYWTAPNLTAAQHKQLKQAAAIMKAAVETKPNKNGAIKINIDEIDNV